MAAATPLEQLLATLLSLPKTTVNESLVRSLLGLVLLSALALESDTVTLALKLDRGDETLDLRRLLVLLATLGGDLATHNELAHIITLAEVKELADLRHTLRSEADWLLLVGEARNLLLALLHDNGVENREVMGHDATTHRLALHLTSAALTVALAALLEEKAHAVGAQHTLHHGETLLVVPSGDTEAVAFELVTEGVASDLLRHTLVEEWEQFLVLLNGDAFLEARLGAAHVELHGGSN